MIKRITLGSVVLVFSLFVVGANGSCGEQVTAACTWAQDRIAELQGYERELRNALTEADFELLNAKNDVDGYQAEVTTICESFNVNQQLCDAANDVLTEGNILLDEARAVVSSVSRVLYEVGSALMVAEMALSGCERGDVEARFARNDAQVTIDLAIENARRVLGKE